MDIQTAARALGGEVTGANTILCPGPDHTDDDRSLSVTFTDKGFVVNSFSGDDWRQCRDHVMKCLDQKPVLIDAKQSEESRKKKEYNRALAMAIWEHTEPLPEAAHLYLKRRGLSYSGDVLRWHANCPFDHAVTDCMVALVQNIVTNEPQAIHRTAIDGFGRKMDHLGKKGRLALGPTGEGAIKLITGQGDLSTLCIAEGIETALSFPVLIDPAPVWSVLSANGIRDFPAVRGPRRIIIAADNDRPDKHGKRAGTEAANAARERLTRHGFAVGIIQTNEQGTDLNDVVMGNASA